MPSVQQFPNEIFKHGSSWIKADFHLHTRSDKEFSYSGKANSFVNDYVDRLKTNDIHLGVIANHNKFDMAEFKALRKKAKKYEVFLLPGVELSVNDGFNGIHTLIVYSEQWLENGKDYINQFLNATFTGKTPDQYENENGRSQDNLIGTIKKLDSYNRDYFLIFAHVEQRSGLWNELDGGRLSELGMNDLFRRRTKAFQKVRTHNKKDGKCRTKIQNWLGDWYPAEVEGSDCKNIEEAGKIEESYIKIGSFSFEAIQYALSDDQNRVAKEIPVHSQSFIKSVSFEGGILKGKEIPFSSELNALIGIRGSGKSAIIESLRYVLNIPFGEKVQDDEYKNKLIRYTLGSGGKVAIKAVDRFGQEYTVRRILNEHPEVLKDGIVQPGVTIKETVINKPIYFGQKDLSSSGEGFEKDLVEKLISEHLNDIRLKIEKQKGTVQEAVRRYLKLTDIDERIQEYTDKKRDAKHNLEKFKQFKIEEQLKKQLDFDADISACDSMLSSIDSFIRAMEELLAEHEDTLRNHVRYKSNINSDFFKAFFEEYGKVISSLDEIKRIIQVVKTSGSILTTRNGELESLRKTFNEEFASVERKLAEQLQDSGVQAIRPDDFKKISRNLEQAKNMLTELEKEKAKSEQVHHGLLSELSQLNELWHEEFKIIVDELEKVNMNHSSLSIKNEYKGDNKAYIQFLKDTFRGSGLKETTFKKITEKWTDFHVVFNNLKNINNELGNSSAKFTEYFLKYMEVYLTWQKPNKFDIEYQGKPLTEHSLGQRASALILFVLSQKDNDLIIIDQPEDDLDNQTIYEDVIKLVKKLKPKTQFIFATHNPNIPVLGDAEQIISCKYSENNVSILVGSVDDAKVQNEIVGIMEGGEEAFKKRKEIYQIWKPRSS